MYLIYHSVECDHGHFTLHNHNQLHTCPRERYTAVMCDCCARPACPCLWGSFGRSAGAEGRLWGADGPDRMLSVSRAGGCSSTRRATSPRTRRSAPSSARWREWATPTWTDPRGCGTWPTTSSRRRWGARCKSPAVAGMMANLGHAQMSRGQHVQSMRQAVSAKDHQAESHEKRYKKRRPIRGQIVMRIKV